VLSRHAWAAEAPPCALLCRRGGTACAGSARPRNAVQSPPGRTPCSPPRRTIVGPFVPRRPRHVALVPVAGGEAEEDGWSDPTLNLMDVCGMLEKEREAVSETTIVQCRLKADLVLADTAALLRSRHGSYHPGLARMDTEVAEIAAMTGSCYSRVALLSRGEAANSMVGAVELLEAEELPATVFEIASRIESSLVASDTE